MKRWRVCLSMGAVLAAAAVSASGCDKMVHTTVIAEQEEKGQKQSLASAEAGSVSEQVKAPEKYTADSSWDQHLTLTADAPVEVPDVEAIRLKKVHASVLSDEVLESWAETVCAGEKAAVDEADGIVEGKVTVDQLPYIYSYSRASSPEVEEDRTSGLTFYLRTDWESVQRTADGLKNVETGESITGTAKTPEECQMEAKKLLQAMGLSDFTSSCYVSQEEVTYGWQNTEIENLPIPEITLVYERAVEGIPVTGTFSVEYPMYQEGAAESVEESSLWGPEFLEITYLEGRMVSLTYTGPVDISDYSDETLFLLPFEEIRQIFENTIGEKMTGSGDRVYGAASMMPEQSEEIVPVWIQYPDAGFEDIQIQIQKVRLGYMRVREEETLAPGKEEGILIPVWDFFGTWIASSPSEDGRAVGEKMENEAVSLLTVDARDGTVLQRRVGY